MKFYLPRGTRFPKTPEVGDTYQTAGITYTWNGKVWRLPDDIVTALVRFDADPPATCH
jgi:hypothetical protein